MRTRRTALSRRSFLLSSAALAGCTAIGGTTTGGRVNGSTVPGTLRYTDGEGVSGLNDHLVPQLSVGFLSNLHQGFLLRYDERDRPYADLAVDVPSLTNGGISRDGLTLTYHLKRGIKWSDGAPFTADDVVFTTHASLDASTNDLYHSTFDHVADVSSKGPDVVVFRLKNAYAPFTDGFFSSDGSCIYPKHLLQNVASIDRSSYNDLPIGLGPFKVAKWNRDDSVLLDANPDFHLGRPKLDKIVYKITTNWNTIVNQIRTGDLDLAMLMPVEPFLQGRDIKGFHGVDVPGGTFSQFSFNLTHPPLNDVVVRQALRYATNRRLLAQNVFHGLVDLQETPLGGQSPHRDTHIPFHEYDPQRAARMLSADGWSMGSDKVRVKAGQRLAFDLMTTTGSPERDAVAAIVQADWAKIGIEATIKHYSATMMYGTYAAGGILERGKYDIEQSHQGYGLYGDLSAIFACRSQPPAGVNTEHYCSKDFDREIDAFNAAYDPAVSQRDADAWQQRLADDLPTIVLGSARDLYIVSDDFKNFYPRASFDGSERWTI